MGKKKKTSVDLQSMAEKRDLEEQNKYVPCKMMVQL